MKAKKYLQVPIWWPDFPGNWRAWLPSRGNVLFTLLVVAGLLWAQSAGALPLGRVTGAPLQTSTTIAYQGRLADANGNPLTGTYNMIFRLYDVPTGGTPLWEEQWTGSNAVKVSDGLFNVMLGSLTAIPQSVIAGRDQLWLGITVGTDDEMQPRVQLGSVPWAVQALTVPDGSITTAKIADGAVTSSKLNVDNGLAVTGNWPQIELRDPATTNKGKIGIGTVRMSFHTGNPPVERMAILHSNGNVGIGTEAPLSRLHVVEGGHLNAIFENRSNSEHMALVVGSAGTGLRFSDTNFFFIGRQPFANRNDQSAGTPLLKITPSGTLGTTDIYGDFRVNNGTKSAVVQAGAFGPRRLYSAESPEVRFFDEGLSRLQNGIARVELDPIFVETIEGEYLVHVTPYGDASLYVAEVGQDYFVVKAREGDPNVTFAWRLSAIRKGYAGVRLEAVK